MSLPDQPRVAPDAERVARRALVLAAVVCRSTIEDDGASVEAESLRQSVVTWLADTGAAAEVTAAEWALLQAPLGTLDPEPRRAGTWCSEALAVLAWALERTELPGHDTQSDPFAIAQALGFHHARERTVLAAPRLRSPDELVGLARELEDLGERLRAAGGPSRAGGEELLVGGLPLAEAPEAIQHALRRMTSERARAASWLIDAGAALPSLGTGDRRA